MPGHFKYMLFSCTFLLLGINILIFYIYHYTIDKSSESTQLQIQLQKEYDMTEYYKSLFNQHVVHPVDLQYQVHMYRII